MPHRNILSQLSVLRMSPSSTADLFLASLFINFLGLGLPLTLMQVYDRIIPNKAEGTLVWLILGCSIAIIVEASLRYCRDRISSWLGCRYEHLVSSKAINKILETNLAEVEKENVAIHLNRLQAIPTLKSFYCNQFFQNIFDLPFALAYIGVIWWLQPQIGIFLVILILSTLLFIMFMRPLYRISINKRTTSGNSKLGLLIEAITKIHFIKSFAEEEKIVQRFEKAQQELTRSEFSAQVIGFLPNDFGVLLSQITLFSVIAIGAGPVINGEITLGVLTACMMLANRAVMPAYGMIAYWFKGSEVKSAKEKVEKIFSMNRVESVSGPSLPGGVEGAILIEQLSFRTRPEQPLLFDDISYRIAPKSILGFSATNSSGSTELMCLLCGIYKPTKGHILIDDYDISLWSQNDLKGKIEYIPPEPILFNGTVLDNLALFEHSNYDIAMDVASMLHLDEKIAQLPNGYKTELTRESAYAMPSGVIRLIALARALVLRPKILLLDKMDSGLDQDSLEILVELFDLLSKECTIVVVSDNRQILNKADRVVQITDGKIVGTSRHSLIPATRDAQVQIWKGVA